MRFRATFLRKRGGAWLKSYVMVVLSIMVVLTIYSVIILSQVRNDVDSNNLRSAEYNCSIIEKRLQSIQDFSALLLFSKNAKKIHTYQDAEMGSAQMLNDAYALVADIRSFIQSNEMLEDIMVFYPESDYIIGNNGCFPAYVYYKSVNVSPEPAYDLSNEWKTAVLTGNQNGFFTFTALDDEPIIYYYANTNFGFGNEPRAVIAKISKACLNEFLVNMQFDSVYSFAGLVDESGEIVSQAGDVELYNKCKAGGALSAFDGMVLHEIDSDLWPLTFATVTDFAMAYKVVRSTHWILLIGLAAALIIGFCVAMFYAEKDKQNMDKIVKRFDASAAPDNSIGFDYIGAEIDKLFERNKHALYAVEQQEKIIGSFFLRDLLQRKNLTEKDVGMLCSMYHINMENPLFSLVVAWQEKGQLPYNDLLAFASKAANEKFAVYCTQVEKFVVFLCNYDAQAKFVQAPALEFAKQLRNQYHCQIELSPVMESLGQFEETWAQFRSRFFPKNQQAQNRASSDGGLMMLREFNDAIERDDFTAAIAFASKLDRKLLAGKNENLSFCWRYAVLAELYEMSCTNAMRLQIDKLMDYVRTPQWASQVSALLQRMDQDVNRNVDMRSITQITKEMIDSDYANPQLGLQMIAEYVGVSQSYLSRMFKAEYSMSVIQYLNYVRIEEVKRQIRDGTNNLKVIAMNVGFSSDVNLIRVFKRYEKMTPGKYRSVD